MPPLSAFTAHELGDGLVFFEGRLPAKLVWDAAAFETAWALHPERRPSIRLIGRQVRVPRWHQAYGEDYRFSGQVSNAQPIPPHFVPFLTWARAEIHSALNGLLVNWYQGPSHYIGPHNDSTKNMIAGAPIVTISFGEERKFRLSRGKEDEREVKDFRAANGTVFVLPQDTNAAWKHSVPRSRRYTGRRISVTLRAFASWVE